MIMIINFRYIFVLFCLFNKAVCTSDCIAANGRMINEIENVWTWSCLIAVLTWHLSEGTEESHENLSQSDRSLGRDLNLGFPEYEIGLLARQALQSLC